MEPLDDLRSELLAQVADAATLDALEQLRVGALGKKGRITGQLKALSGLDADTRRAAGQALNRLKDDIAAAIDDRRRRLADADLDRRLAGERIDMTLTPRPEAAGRIHPISQTIDEVVAIFGAMGFVVAEGPDIEDDWHNFTALNIPPEHPARQEMDTFYLPGERDGHRLVLRTHTSPVQIRTMLSSPPPLRIIAPGRTYRSDSDATHSPMFHQVEGLIVDDAIHMGHLKGCLIDFLRAYFGIDDLPVRFRPSYFPFTEPSAEVDIGCRREGGQLIIGAGDDWLEILGCGMVNPAVLTAAGINADRHQGFAFGMGLERIAMLKYGIPDLRTFFESDLRWLRHYGFAPVIVPDSSGATGP
jgi:phenylalanyl-tRNA synthetase alpha chain